jgi:hypothetical protein
VKFKEVKEKVKERLQKEQPTKLQEVKLTSKETAQETPQIKMPIATPVP